MKSSKNVSRSRALDYAQGYTCANDVSARDWQIKWGGGPWCRDEVAFDIERIGRLTFPVALEPVEAPHG